MVGYGAPYGYGSGYGYGVTGDIHLTETAFEALNDYKPSQRYIVAGVGTYVGATLVKEAEWSYAVGDLHVSKTGNDTTGDGSFANPYLTIGKAVSVVSSAGGVAIWVGAGTYAENNTGAGYLLFSAKSYTAPLVIRAVPGASVTLTNASSTNAIRFTGACSNIVFQRMTIKAAAGSSTAANIPSGSNACSGLEFRDCNFADDQANAFGIFVQGTNVSDGIAVKRCAFTSAGNFAQYFTNCANLRFIGCTHTLTGTGGGHAIRLLQLTGTSYVVRNTIAQPNQTSGSRGIFQESALSASATIYVRHNVVTSVGRCIEFTGGAVDHPATIYCDENVVTGDRGISLSGGTINSTCMRNRVSASGNVGIGWPTDSGSPLLAVDSLVEGNRIEATGTGGHALLIGFNSSRASVRGNVSDASQGGTYGLVLKGDGHSVEANEFIGGNFQSIYLKGATNCTVSDNDIIQSVAGGQAIDFAADDVTAAADNTITGNRISITDGMLYGFTGLEIGTGNVLDANEISISGSGTWGSMFSSAVNSIEDVRASWGVNYDVTTNDANSVVV